MIEEKPSGYYEGLNTVLLDAIPKDATAVLEIGCAVGALGAAYKDRNPGCAYYGVEIHPPSAEIAAGRLDKVFCASVEEVDLSSLERSIDCIVYGDVLEHLVDPWAVLKKHRSLLKPGGRIAACIPNIQHWSLLQHLLQGNWVYSDHGLLDRTHLRFFTLNTIFTSLVESGYRVETMIGVRIDEAGASAFVERMAPGLINMGIDLDTFRQRCSALQYLAIASPA
jgi:2-polyprenyl-3-methyl-5-hydroxy-6-metoxy-1,4-benzoquinol methylase